MCRKIIIILLASAAPYHIFAQGATIPISSSIYPFLERLETFQTAKKTLPSHRPLTRIEAAQFLLSVDTTQLTPIDKQKFAQFLNELHFEVNQSFSKKHSKKTSWTKKKLFFWLPKGIYESHNDFFHFKKQEFAIRINPRIRMDYTKSPSKDWNRQQRIGLGWSFQSQWNEIGVSFRYLDHMDKVPSKNAMTFREWRIFGNSDIAFQGESESYLTRNPQDWTKEKTSEEYIVSTASLSYTWKTLNFLIGRETVGWGPGVRQKLMLGQQISPIDQLRLDFQLLDNLRFVYLHGWLLNDPPVTDTMDFPEDAKPRVLDRQRYVAAHRLEWRMKKWITIGLSESVIYGDRAPELPYLIPINLFYATEHNRRDNDNKSLAVDVKFQAIPKQWLYGGIWIDDLTTGKLGTGFIQNKFGYLVGSILYDPLTLKNSRFVFEYARMDPFAGSHFYQINRYEHWGKPLGLDLLPHSDQWSLLAEWEPFSDWKIYLESTTTRHIDSTILGDLTLASGSLFSHYPPAAYHSSLQFGNGRGRNVHDLQATISYELFEHCFIMVKWRQKRIGVFNTQNSGSISNQKHNSYLPGLFDWSNKHYSQTYSQWVLSFLFNFDR
ncbi:MAG: hypothetical protein N2450_07135 [bacterium]|nr:hypothetical protein [bacterium]